MVLISQILMLSQVRYVEVFLLSGDLTSDTLIQLGVKESDRSCETAWRRINWSESEE